MKLAFIILTSILVLCKLNAQSIKYDITKLENAPIIDGQLDELWKTVPEIADMQFILDQDWEIVPDDTLDASPKFRLAWNDTSLFIYAETYDDTLHKDGLQLHQEQSRGYNDDCFEFFFDGNNSHADWDGVDDTEMWFLVEEPDVQFYTSETCPIPLSNIVFKQNIWKDASNKKIGWSIEIAIPLSDLNIPATEGHLFGLDLKYSDDDGKQLTDKSWMPGADREHNIRWSDNVDFHPPSTWYYVVLDSLKTTSTINENNIIALYNVYYQSNNKVLVINNAKQSIKPVNINIQVFDVKGALIHQSQRNSTQQRIEAKLESLNPGIYFWNVQNQNGKFIVE